jgi:hypothetical protein
LVTSFTSIRLFNFHSLLPAAFISAKGNRTASLPDCLSA